MQGSGENDVAARLMEIQFKIKILSKKINAIYGRIKFVKFQMQKIAREDRMAYCSINQAKLNNQMVIKA